MCVSALKSGVGVDSVGKHGEVCLGCGEKCGKCVGVGRGVGRCWKRSKECEKVWGEMRCGGCW